MNTLLLTHSMCEMGLEL